jgi:hypothetical protein
LREWASAPHGGYGSGKAAEALGANPQQQELAEQIGFWLPSVAGAGFALRGRVAEGPNQSKIAAADVLGGKAAVGVARTPTEYSAGIKVGEQRFSVSVPRRQPLGPEMQIAPEAVGPDAPAAAAAAAPIPHENTMRSEQAIANMANSQAVRAGIVPQVKPPSGPQELTPDLVQGLAQVIASHPPEQRGALLKEAHGKLTEWMLERGTFTTPDGKLATVKNEGQAATLATKIINEQIDAHDAAQGKQAPAPKAAAEQLTPEKPETIAAQMEALKDGRLPVVYIPKGTPVPALPKDVADWSDAGSQRDDMGRALTSIAPARSAARTSSKRRCTGGSAICWVTSRPKKRRWLVASPSPWSRATPRAAS